MVTCHPRNPAACCCILVLLGCLQIRNHILALWRGDVTQYLSEEAAVTRMPAKYKQLASAAWTFLDREGHINWGVAPAIMDRGVPEKPETVVVIGAGLAGGWLAAHLAAVLLLVLSPQLLQTTCVQTTVPATTPQHCSSMAVPARDAAWHSKVTCCIPVRGSMRERGVGCCGRFSSSCAATLLPPTSPAGLSAARQLRNHGYKVLVLEGADRPGGRVHTHRMEVRQRGVHRELQQAAEVGSMPQLAALSTAHNSDIDARLLPDIFAFILQLVFFLPELVGFNVHHGHLIVGRTACQQPMRLAVATAAWLCCAVPACC